MMSILLPNRNEPGIDDLVNKIADMYENVQIIVCNDPESNGKGWAIRQGLKAVKGNTVCFLDGDGDIDPKMIKRLFPYIEDYDIVCGVKPISGLWSRRILTFFSRIYLAFCFNIKVDSQTGIKLFKKEAISEFYNDGFLFDLEIICKAKQNGFSMIEAPIEANINRRMKVSSIWNTLKESVTLWLELR
jgi:glycosyltransferase involved in cell wall biosynthesis